MRIYLFGIMLCRCLIRAPLGVSGFRFNHGRFLSSPLSKISTSIISDESIPSTDVPMEALDSFFGDRVPFDELGFRSKIVQNMRKTGFECSTTIQAKSATPILSGQDVVIGAETGSGKTYAYLLPLIEKLLQNTPKEPLYNNTKKKFESYPRALILVPNRELVKQLLSVVQPICEGLPITFGTSPLTELTKWPFIQNKSNQAPDVLVCTPILAYETSFYEEFFDRLELIVLDEADMLLEGGFAKHIDGIILARKLAFRRLLIKARDNEASTTSDGNETSSLSSRIENELNETIASTQNDTVPSSHGLKPGRKLSFHEKKYGIGSAGDGLQACQVVMSAATLPNYGLKSVNELVKKIIPNATRVENDLLHCAPSQIKHTWIELEDTKTTESQNKLGSSHDIGPSINDQHFNILVDLLKKELEVASTHGKGNQMMERTMIFCNSAARVNFVFEKLSQAGVPCLPFHKLIKREDREMNLAVFSADSDMLMKENLDIDSQGTPIPRVLVCTDLASRGLDIPFVGHIIQFDFALNVVQHLHRMGRTGRAGRAGRVTHFIDPTSPLVSSIRSATENNDAVEQSFSRRRSFTNRSKKSATGKFVNSKGKQNISD